MEFAYVYSKLIIVSAQVLSFEKTLMLGKIEGRRRRGRSEEHTELQSHTDSYH